MGLKLVRSMIFSVLTVGGFGALHATPMLRLVSATVGPISIVPGANGINQTVEAYNAGDGTLSLSVSSSVAWITPSVGATRACQTTTAATSCVPLIFGLNTASLAASTTAYTGVVTVTAPNTVDAPQTVTVTVMIGSSLPSSITAYVAPYAAPPAQTSTVAVPFTIDNALLTWKVTTEDGASWLRMTLTGGNPFDPGGISACPCAINITPQPTNTAGNTYTGSIVTANSNFAPDNKTIAVTMIVTSLPIAQPSVTQVTQLLAVGAPKLTQYIVLGNSGLGTLAITGATATGSGITAAVVGPYAAVTFDPTGLAPGTYTGSVSVATNAANSPTAIPVTFQVEAAAAPTVFYHGVVDDAVFGGSGFTVNPGDVIALFGDQLSFQAPLVGPAPPLAATLGGASVFVNGEQAPLYFASYGQINFQMPVDTVAGTALVEVQTNGQTSNAVSLTVGSRAPRLLVLAGTGGYGAIVDASQGNGYNTLPTPSTVSEPGFITEPASRGDVLTIYAIGLGTTSPAVATGQPAPATAPLAQLTQRPTVNFGVNLGGVPVNVTGAPAFAGLAPYYAGLYQVNVAIPQDCPAGTVQVSLTFPDSTSSNAVNIQVQ